MNGVCSVFEERMNRFWGHIVLVFLLAGVVGQVEAELSSFDPSAKVKCVTNPVHFYYEGNESTYTSSISGLYYYFQTKAEVSNYTGGSLWYSLEGYSDEALTQKTFSHTTHSADLRRYIAGTDISKLSNTHYVRVLAAENRNDLFNHSLCLVSEPVRVTVFSENDICRQGTLLYKEDFGGNNTSDPAVCPTPVEGLLDPAYYGGTNKYTQITSGIPNPNSYIICKSHLDYGSAWYRMTDHTYSGDHSRGYYVLANGAAGQEKIYSTRLDQVCGGMHLTFTAYFANIVTTYQSDGAWKEGYADAAFRMEVRDAVADTVVMSVPTSALPRRGMSGEHGYYSNHPWELLGFPFVVPEGVTSLEFAIYNNVESGTQGMDYVLDDIEIRSCDPTTVAITSPVGCCIGDPYQFRFDCTNNGFYTEPLRYRWQYAADGETWADVSTDEHYQIDHMQLVNAGYYRLLVGDESTIASTNCCAISEPIYVTVEDCPTLPADDSPCPDGAVLQTNTFDSQPAEALLVIDDDGTTPFFTTTVSDVRPELTYSFSAQETKLSGEKIQLAYRVIHPESGRLVASLTSAELTDDVPHEVAISFTIPKWTFSFRVEVYDVSGSDAHSLALDYATIRLCAPPITLLTSSDDLCSANPFMTLEAQFTDDGSLGSPRTFLYEYSADSMIWETIEKTQRTYHSRRTFNFHEGWYRVSASRADYIEVPNARVTSEPVYMREIDGGCSTRYPMPADVISEDVCHQGTLLFLEDFGGNSPDDPIVRQEKLTSMSSKYRQATNILTTVGSGMYIISKYGFQNNYNQNPTISQWSQWFLQDDHTYPNDYSRGYLLEVDGLGGNDAFYSTTIPVCHELDLSFSAYVANVGTKPDLALPKVRFLITDELTGDTIYEESSGSIERRTDYQPQIPMVHSAPWHFVGTSFHVPASVSLVRLSIFNDVDTDMGNDFAMDDIEIRLCNPVVNITSGHETCQDQPYTFTTTVEGNNPFAQPYAYRWEYATDSLAFDSPDWQTIATTKDLHFDQIKMAQTGWYRFGISDEENINERTCRAMSEPFYLQVIDCSPPTIPELTIVSSSIVCQDSAYCFELDTLNKSDLNDNYRLSTFEYFWEFSSNGTTWTEAANTQDYCFTASKNKEGYYRLVLTYQDKWNDIRHTYDSFQLKTKDCSPPPLPDAEITSAATTCLDSAYCFEVTIKNADVIADTIVLTYHWEFSHNGGVWGDLSIEKDFCFDAVTNNDACWYRVTVGFLNDEWPGSYTSYPFLLNVKDCTPPLPQVEIIGEHEVCYDSAYCFTPNCTNGMNMANPLYAYQWQTSGDGVIWNNYATGKDLCIPAVETFDPYWYRVVVSYNSANEQTSASEPFLLSVKDCTPPEPPTPPEPVDPPMPPEPGPYPQPDPEPQPEWPEDRLYELIVNKYNWLIVCDNTRLETYFPENKATGFQWYKNGELVLNATEDGYSEQNELSGAFQLYLTLDNNKQIRSNILYIKAEHEKDELIAIYNFMGQAFDIHTNISNLPTGIYIFVYQSGNQTRTEQIFIP